MDLRRLNETGVEWCSLLKFEYYSSENLFNSVSSFCDDFISQKSMIIVNFCFLQPCQIKVKIKQGKSLFY